MLFDHFVHEMREKVGRSDLNRFLRVLENKGLLKLDKAHMGYTIKMSEDFKQNYEVKTQILR